MKKKLFKLISLLTVNFLLLSLSSIVIAGTIGNPTATLEQGQAQIGFEADFMKRDIELKDGGEFETTGNSYMIKGTYGVSEQVNIYAKLGMASLEIDKATLEVYDPQIDDDVEKKFKGDLELAYGLGMNATFYDQDGLKIGAGLHITYVSSEDELVRAGTLQGVSYNICDKTEISALEYALSLGSSYEAIENLTLYGGILISKIDGEYKDKFTVETTPDIGENTDESGKGDLEEDDMFGIFLGGDFNATEQFSIGAEARLINETSFSLKFNYAF